MEQSVKYRQWLARFNVLPEPSQKMIAQSLLGKSLELYVDPTGKCNFRCGYCYESFTLGRMNRQLIESVKLFIMDNMIGRRVLYLNWFGGEPLTAFPVVENITKWAQMFCQNSGFLFQSSMTTNGYNLDRKMAENLLGMGMSAFQITLDGPENKHDMIRKLANGGPTFDRIWTNLLRLREMDAGFRVIIRVHIRKDNAICMEELLADIENNFKGDDRFMVGLHPLENLGGDGVGSVALLSRSQFADIKKRLDESGFSKIKDLTGSDISPPGHDSTTVGNHQKICYACKPNSFHIRADGSIGKCTVAIDQEFNDLGRLDEFGKIVIDKKKMSRWTHALVSLDPAEMKCPLSRMGLAHPSPENQSGC